jgi:hypothetical protein
VLWACGFEMPRTFLSFHKGYAFLYDQIGPVAEGIFRNPSNRKSCRTLNEKLNSVVKEDLDGESVLVVASVLKVRKVLALTR